MFDTDLLLQTASSPSTRFCLALLLLIVLLACLSSALEWPYQIVFTLLALWAWNRSVLWFSRPINLRYTAENGWSLAYAGGAFRTMTLLSSSVAVRPFVLLHLRDTDQRVYSVFIARDSLMPRDYRRLFVALKMVESGK